MVERFCSLATSRAFSRAALRLISQTVGMRVETLFETVEQTGPDAPRFGAALERGANMSVARRRRAFAVRRRKSAASVSRILGLSRGRPHLA